MARSTRPQGRGIYIWRIRWMLSEFGDYKRTLRDDKSDHAGVAMHIQDQGFKWVIWKVLEGSSDYQEIEDTIKVSDILRVKGVQIWGYQYCYPGGIAYAFKGSINAQVNAAVTMVGRMGLDGFVIDAESQMKNHPTGARQYASGLRAGLPKTPIALSTYRYPELHPEFPWESYLPFIDLNMPQMYWQGSHNPAWQLQKTKDQYDRLIPGMDLIPIGSAYGEHGWVATEADLIEFHEKVVELGYLAEGYWEYISAVTNNLMGALSALPDDFPEPPPTGTPVPLPPTPSGSIEDRLQALEAQLADLTMATELTSQAVVAVAEGVDKLDKWAGAYD